MGKKGKLPKYVRIGDTVYKKVPKEKVRELNLEYLEMINAPEVSRFRGDGLQANRSNALFHIYGVPKEGVNLEGYGIDIKSVIADIAESNVVTLLYRYAVPVLQRMLKEDWLIYDERVIPSESSFEYLLRIHNMDAYVTSESFSEWVDYMKKKMYIAMSGNKLTTHAATWLDCLCINLSGCESIVSKYIGGKFIPSALATKLEQREFSELIKFYDENIERITDTTDKKKAIRKLKSAKKCVGMKYLIVNPEQGSILPREAIILPKSDEVVGVGYTNPEVENFKKANSMLVEVRKLIVKNSI